MNITFNRAEVPALFRRRASSFSFAAMFLSKPIREKVIRVYHFLRRVDDFVDGAGEQQEQIRVIHHQIETLEQGDTPDSLRDAQLPAEISHDVVRAFLFGQLSDAASYRIKTEDDLLVYCYQVAGTVGLMLCAVMNVRHWHAHIFAARLGIAMQLTNIARDVAEDARRSRVYLPSNWLPPESVMDAVTNSAQRQRAEAAVIRILKMAEFYYESASEGLSYLPARERFAVMLARRLYRQIGRKILKNPEQIWQRRVHVGFCGKAIQFAITTAEWLVTLLPTQRLALRAQIQATR